jgi:hypothetical protein
MVLMRRRKIVQTTTIPMRQMPTRRKALMRSLLMGKFLTRKLFAHHQ